MTPTTLVREAFQRGFDIPQTVAHQLLEHAERLETALRAARSYMAAVVEVGPENASELLDRAWQLADAVLKEGA